MQLFSLIKYSDSSSCSVKLQNYKRVVSNYTGIKTNCSSYIIFRHKKQIISAKTQRNSVANSVGC